MTPTDTRLSRKNVTLPCFSTSTCVTVHFRGSACGKSHPLQAAYTNLAPASGPMPALLCTFPYEGYHTSLRGKGCTEYAQDRPVSAGGDPWTHPQMPLRLSVPSTTTTIISSLAWLSCNDVMLGGPNVWWMAGCRRELLEILEIDWEAHPRCGTQSPKEDRRRENRWSRLVGAPN